MRNKRPQSRLELKDLTEGRGVWTVLENRRRLELKMATTLQHVDDKVARCKKKVAQILKLRLSALDDNEMLIELRLAAHELR